MGVEELAAGSLGDGTGFSLTSAVAFLRIATTSSCLRSTAKSRGVLPYCALACGSAPSLRSSVTISGRPFAATLIVH